MKDDVVSTTVRFTSTYFRFGYCQ